ncbi:MAG: FAD-dependent oxidoreductase [Micrococcus sp.]|nr:FAD-dependent oxidoreductase [Micrococcus sp.]
MSVRPGPAAPRGADGVASAAEHGTPRRIVIVGHGIAGLTAGDTLRAEGFDGELVVVGQEWHAPYSRPALSKAMLSDPTATGPEPEAQALAAPSDGARVLAGRSAVRLDPTARTVHLDDGTALDYDELVIASGARPRRFTDSPDELTLRTLDDARALRRRLVGRPEVTVIGGGPLGMEVASAARESGCDVTLLQRGVPMQRHVGAFLGGMCTAAARERGVRVVDATVTAVRPSPAGGLRLELSDGTVLAAGTVVTAIGDEANVEWLAGSGLLSDGRLLTDERGVVAPGIVAAGDVAWRRTGAGLRRRSLWTDAIEQARAAALALLHGPDAAPADYAPYFWTEQFGLNVRICGEVPAGVTPTVVDGDLAEPRALLQWEGPAQGGAAAAVNFRISVPRLRRLARPAAVPA